MLKASDLGEDLIGCDPLWTISDSSFLDDERMSSFKNIFFETYRINDGGFREVKVILRIKNIVDLW